jgi:hypothetical protein
MKLYASPSPRRNPEKRRRLGVFYTI